MRHISIAFISIKNSGPDLTFKTWDQILDSLGNISISNIVLLQSILLYRHRNGRVPTYLQDVLRFAYPKQAVEVYHAAKNSARP